MAKVAIVFAVLIVGNSGVHGQMPSINQMSKDLDVAANNFSEKSNSLLGFKKLEMPKPLEGLLDIRFRKPELPKFGFLEKLKNIGKPQFADETPTQGPFMSGLSKLFQPRPRTEPGFFSRMFGNSEDGLGTFSGARETSELSKLSQGLQDHVDRMSRQARTGASELFGTPGTSDSPQPPLRSARQFSGSSQSRF